MSNRASKGPRFKTRHLLARKHSKATVNKLLETFPIGSKVDIRLDGSVHSGMPPTRYQGKTATVIRKQGKSFVVKLLKLNKPVELIIHAAHLHLSKGTQSSGDPKSNPTKTKGGAKNKVNVTSDSEEAEAAA